MILINCRCLLWLRFIATPPLAIRFQLISRGIKCPLWFYFTLDYTILLTISKLLIHQWNGLDPLQWNWLINCLRWAFPSYHHANISFCWIYGIRLDCLLILYHPPVRLGFRAFCWVAIWFTPFRIVSNHCALFFSCACGFVMMAFLNFNCYAFTALLTLWLRLVHLCHWMPSVHFLVDLLAPDPKARETN